MEGRRIAGLPPLTDFPPVSGLPQLTATAAVGSPMAAFSSDAAVTVGAKAGAILNPGAEPRAPAFISSATVLLLKAIGLHEGFGEHDLERIITHCACRVAQDAGLGVLARAVADHKVDGPLERAPP